MNSELISIVVPLYNEEENVSLLYGELSEVVEKAGLRVEFIFVDDGSSDKTCEKLLETAHGDRRIRLVKFRRNFGQTKQVQKTFSLFVTQLITCDNGKEDALQLCE